MDPLETINIAGDSTFALMLAAQARGHTLRHYAAGALSYREGRVTAPARPVTVERVASDHFRFGDWQAPELQTHVDAVLMWQDPTLPLDHITDPHATKKRP